MTFYLKPPEGSIPPYKFEQFAENRLRLLLAILDNSDKRLSEIIQICNLRSWQLDCIIEGTPKDRVSHFALRASVITNFALIRVVEDSERLLFEKRLQNMSAHELENSVKSFARHLKKYKPFFATKSKNQTSTEYIEATYRVLGQIVSGKLLTCRQRSLQNSDHEDMGNRICPIHVDSHILKFPFIHILELVRSREVHLSRGFAYLTCPQLSKYLICVFAKILEFSTHTMRQSATIRKSFDEDSRFSDVSKRLRSIFHSHGQAGMIGDGRHSWITPCRLLPAATKISLNTLDFEASQYFPPCMRNHYTTLRRTHRLPHASRFQFTLFLKDIGLSVEDCINLLKEEYSKSACEISDSQSATSSPGKCTHSWDKDGNRYVYGTRHMYGLEGARKNYASHSCESIIKDTSFGCGDGCPFVGCHQNVTFLKNIEMDLENMEILDGNVPEFLSILRSETQTRILPIESCHVYLNFKRQKWEPTSGSATRSTTTAIQLRSSKPSHFYTSLRNSAIVS